MKLIMASTSSAKIMSRALTRIKGDIRTNLSASLHQAELRSIQAFHRWDQSALPDCRAVLRLPYTEVKGVLRSRKGEFIVSYRFQLSFSGFSAI